MRSDISLDRIGGFCRRHYKAVILIAILLRVVAASVYDIYVNISGHDALLPDGRWYSVNGRYIMLLMEGQDGAAITTDEVPPDPESRRIMRDVIRRTGGGYLPRINESSTFIYMLGIIYYLFGYADIWVRVLNILLSVACTLMIFDIARKHFGETAAHLFLLAGLLLPTQFIYSITLSKDFIRMFFIYGLLWGLYGKTSGRIFDRIRGMCAGFLGRFQVG